MLVHYNDDYGLMKQYAFTSLGGYFMHSDQLKWHTIFQRNKYSSSRNYTNHEVLVTSEKWCRKEMESKLRKRSGLHLCFTIFGCWCKSANLPICHATISFHCVVWSAHRTNVSTCMCMYYSVPICTQLWFAMHC